MPILLVAVNIDLIVNYSRGNSREVFGSGLAVPHLTKGWSAVEPGQTPSTVAVHLDGCEPIKFDILNFPVLSLERAGEVAGPNRVQNPGKRLLLASRQLSARTREMLRTAGLSWAEELTGVCHLVGPGLLV